MMMMIMKRLTSLFLLWTVCGYWDCTAQVVTKYTEPILTMGWHTVCGSIDRPTRAQFRMKSLTKNNGQGQYQIQFAVKWGDGREQSETQVDIPFGESYDNMFDHVYQRSGSYQLTTIATLLADGTNLNGMTATYKETVHVGTDWCQSSNIVEPAVANGKHDDGDVVYFQVNSGSDHVGVGTNGVFMTSMLGYLCVMSL